MVVHLLFSYGLSKFGVKITNIDMTDVNNVKEAIKKNTKILYLESPANPNIRLCDIEAISKYAHDLSNLANSDIKVVVDNTYCTPYVQQPLALWADIVGP